MRVLREADIAACNALLRCWVTEQGIPVPETGSVSLPLSNGGVVRAVVEYRSAVGQHRFGAVRLGDSAPSTEASHVDTIDAVRLAELLIDGDGQTDFVSRVDDSVRRVGRYLVARRGETHVPVHSPFLAAEQDLLLGHLMHPTPKSRDGLSETEDSAYAPELRGRFPLHWFAVDPAVTTSDSISSLGAMPALFAELSGMDDGRLMVPAHPWQAGELAKRPAFQQLLAAGAVVPLGPAGSDWYATSSLRTVYRPDSRVMLKLSLGLRITNSRRQNTLTELARGVEVHRLLDSGIDAAVRTAYPEFQIVRDPGYLAVLTNEGASAHLDVSVRDVPTGLTSARCLAGLVAPQPHAHTAAIVSIVEQIAHRSGLGVSEVAREWIRRYVDHVLAPMVFLYASTGIGLEAHQQNTLVVLDGDGWPSGSWYRDNQGYYLASSALPAVLALTGGAETALALAPDSIVDDRLTYYLLFNQALAPIAALGAAGVAAESAMLGALRDGLSELIARGHDTASGLVQRWLTAQTLPRKANMATRVAGIDEVLAPIDNQSVYVTSPNPLLVNT